MTHLILDQEPFTLTVVDLGTITKVTLVNVTTEGVAVKEVVITAGLFSARKQIFNYFR